MENPFEKIERAAGQWFNDRHYAKLQAMEPLSTSVRAYVALVGPVSPADVVRHVEGDEQLIATEADIFRVLRLWMRVDVIDIVEISTDVPPVYVAGYRAPLMGYVIHKGYDEGGGGPAPLPAVQEPIIERNYPFSASDFTGL